MRAIVPAVAALLLASTALLTPANATLTFWANVNGNIISCADQAACDTNSAIGQLGIANQTVGGVQVLGSSQTQTVGPPQNSLNASSFQIINNNAFSVPITVEVGGTSFAVPITSFAASGAGTFQNAVGSNITLNYFIDTANAQGAPGTPGTQVATFSHTDLVANPDSFSFNSGVQPFSATSPFSMTLFASGTLVAGGDLVGRTQAIVNEIAAVPEPASLLILGTGLLGLGYVLNRRRRSDDGDMAAA